jgi:glycosyltransferase involved in cell wall biosynthesis
VAYVLRRFPKLSETFIVNEILALEALGQPFCIFSLLPSRDPRFHEDLSRIKASISYVPDLFEPGTLLRYNLRAARRRPREYAAALCDALGRPRPLQLWRLLQAGYVAERARCLHVRHLHAHFATEATRVAALASRISGIPYSFTAHAVDIYKKDVDRRLLVRHVERAAFTVTVSESNLEHLRKLANGSAHKIVRLYNGIDLDRFEPRRGPSQRPFTILSVARLVEKKGLDVLVEACRLLRERGAGFRCWIVGKGAERARLEAMIRRHGLRGRVELLGPHTQAEIVARYREADLFVLPCLVAGDGNRDGLPVSLVEALASGLPVVATPVTGIPEVVRDGHNGLLVPSGDAPRLADAIESLMRDGAHYESLRANARVSVEKAFDLRRTSRVLHALLLGGAP